MLALPSQTPGVCERFGITRAQADGSAWAFDRSGREFHGAGAVCCVLRALGGPWRPLAWLYFRVPPVAWVGDRVYAFVARHRARLSRLVGATPECDQPGVECAD